MLCKLSFKNIKKSFKDYAIYFFTLVLGVSIFYVFNAIESQTAMLEVTSSTKEVINLMTNSLSAVSVFVSFILGFLIIYASNFLIKRRNKDFGIYLTLGMSKRKISMILFLETLFIGVISLFIGLVLGVSLSQLMSLFVANSFEADLTSFAFTFSSSAFFKTLIYFGIIYLIVMIFNAITISKCKLIDLLYAYKKPEKVKLKNPVLCIILFVIACASLGYSYYLVTKGVNKLDSAGMIFLPIALGAVSTFLIFFSLSGLLLKIVMKMKNVYYKGLNSFTVRQISSKINTTVFSMTIICLMLFITICVFSSSLSIKNSMTNNLKTLAPVDIEIDKTLDIPLDEAENYGYTYEQALDSKLSIRQTLEKLDFDPDLYFTDTLEFNVYATNDITIKETLGTAFDEVLKEQPYLTYDSAETFVKLSDYNKVAKLYGLDTLSLKDDEYVLVADFDQWVKIRNKGLKANTKITLLGKDYYPKYNHTVDGFINISNNHINIGFFVVPDDALDESIKEQNIMIANYKAKGEDAKKEIEQRIIDLDNHPYAKNTNLSASSKLAIYEGSVSLGALVTFIGLYLGIIFLISSAAILALKELSESADNKERFRMLRKLGADEKLINKALFRQIFIFFMFPLLLAIIHSVFGIMFCNYILSTLGTEEVLASIIMTAIFLVIIYGGYFLITYLCSKNIIKERR